MKAKVSALVAILMLLTGVGQAYAAEAAADTIAADTTYVYPLGPIRSLLYHVRVIPARNSDTHLQLYWNYVDSCQYRRVDVTIPAAVHADVGMPMAAEWELATCSGANDSVVNRGTAWLRMGDAADGAMSLILRCDRGGAVLEFGDTQVRQTELIDYDYYSPGALALRSDRRTFLATHTIVEESRIVPEMLDCTLDSAFEIVKNSSGKAAVVWTYLDRNTDPTKLNVDLGYMLMTYPQDNGDLLIVLAQDTATRKALTIIGRLRKTPFANHYDLEWITSDGLMLSIDTSADLQLDGQILALNFPLLDSVIRFRRLELQ